MEAEEIALSQFSKADLMVLVYKVHVGVLVNSGFAKMSTEDID